MVQSGVPYYVQSAAQDKYMGFSNRTCSAGTVGTTYGPTVGPLLRGPRDGTLWGQWTMAVLGTEAGGSVRVNLRTYFPPGKGTPR